MTSISELQSVVHKVNCGNGWWDRPHNDGELIALMHSELSEALEGIRNRDWANVAEEMADTVIRIMDFCEARGINLEEEILKKTEANNKRGYKHGGKEF